MYIYTIKKIIHAFLDLPSSLGHSPHTRLIMTLLVKNEADILEQNILFHKRMGVDWFIITDNASTDSTPQIIEKYVKKGWVLQYIQEPASGYEQKKWVDRMVWLAKKRYKADWIINADADEFWFPVKGNLKTLIPSKHFGILSAKVRNVCPEEGKPYWEWENVAFEVPNPEEYDLSPYSLFSRHYKKVMHRTSGYIQISMGNHKVTMFPHKEKQGNIIIYHFPVRNKEHFIQKMINGGQQLEKHRGKHGGRHWRYLYTIYKKGGLCQEYDRMVGTKFREQLIRDGFLQPDENLKKLFAEYTRIGSPHI
ncbi:MAG: glycosyltransferase family 2 protein [Bacteroidaceae bacterium]